MLKAFASMALLACTLQSAAQTDDPAQAQARVPKPPLPQALGGYRRLDEAPAAGWREANELVLRIGGWRAYAREAAAAAAPAAAPASGPSGANGTASP